MPELEGKIIFGDIVKGRIFFIDADELQLGKQSTIKEVKVSFNGKVTTMIELSGAQKVDMRFGRDHKGELYVMSKPDGRVYRVVSAAKSI
jgi:hypothetical protein